MRAFEGPEHRRAQLGVVLVAVAWLALMVASAGLLAGSQASARRAVAQRLQARAAGGAEFVSLYVRDILAREGRQASIWLAARRPAPGSLQRAADAIGVSAAVLLDGDGRVLQVLPAKPALLGRIITGKYRHLASAVAGSAAVSNVVSSAARGVPVVGFAEPFFTVAGRRVFSGAFDVSATPLGQYMSQVIVIPGRRVYLVDGTGALIASTGRPPRGGETLAELDGRLARLARTQLSGSYTSAHGSQSFVSARVPGTPWRIVAAVPDSRLYNAVNGISKWLAWVALIGLALAGLLIIGIGSWLLHSRRELDFVARVDPLTGLRNRRDLAETLEAAISAAQRRRTSLAVLMIDVDRFKDINDTLGHKAGDAVLMDIAQKLRAATRIEDALGRWGGEEFLAVLPDTCAEGALVTAERLRAAAAADRAVTNPRPRVTVTIGVAVWVAGGPDELVRRADTALYAGKAAGRDTVQLAPLDPEPDGEASHREGLETSIPAAR
jgi:diguanylate cyclase (GGDEF)-like protein